MDAQQLSREAARILADPIIISAFQQARQDALEALASADVDNKTMILRLQSKAAVIDEVLGLLQGAMHAGHPLNGQSLA